MKPDVVQPIFSLQRQIFVAMVLVCAAALGVPTRAQLQTNNPDLPMLEVGQPVERPLAGGEAHSYRLRLEAGQFVKFELWQRETIIQVTIYGPTGERLFQRYRTSVPTPQGRLHVGRLVVENAGVYQVELTPLPDQKTAGQYQLTLVEQQPANEDDRALQSAVKGLLETAAMQGRYQYGTVDDRTLIREQQEFDRIISLGERSLSVFQRLLPPNDGDIGNLAIVLGNMYALRGYYGDSERIEQVHEIAAINREHMVGPHDYQVALLYQLLGKEDNPVLAERWFRKAVASAEGITDDPAFLADVLSDLASNLRELGETARANELFQRVAQMVERLLAGSDCTAESGCYGKLVVALINLGTDLLGQDDLAGAERYLRQAQVFFEHPKVGGTHGRKPELPLRLGQLYQRKGEYAQAESFFRQLIEQDEMNGNHPLHLGNYQRQLGSLLLAKGDYTQAAESFRQAQKALEKTGKSPALARLMRDWRRLHLAIGQTEEALAAQQQAVEITEANLSQLLVSGSEWEKLKHLASAQDETFETLALHAQYGPHSDAALRLAFTTLLQRKGRLLDEMNRTVALLRLSANEESTGLMKDWVNKASQISMLTSKMAKEEAPANRLARLEKLNQEYQQLQRRISARSAQFRAQVLPPVTLDDVRRALPSGSALVEFAQYQPEDVRARQKAPPRYLAYVLPKEGAPQWKDLGEAAKIDAAVGFLRQAISDKSLQSDWRAAARKLDEMVMRPIRPLLGRARTVFLSPDGELNIAPFAALRDEGGRYLIEDYLFIYLTSGRDLLRLQVKHESQPEKLIFAVSDFDGQTVAAPSAAKPTPIVSDTRGGRLSANATMVMIRFNQLKFARAEGEAVQRAVPQAKLYTGGQATETLLKQVHRPYFLHIVTHGFFLPEGDQKLENPLLRSGLALAGANQRRSGEDDGLLTAFEAAALDLWGTKLVVLSACGTGLGEVKNGEGVFGLRRALVLAGAETQLATLWDIDDEVTGDLMKKYYQRLARGEGRAEALRQVQLEMLRGKANRHPRFWASFVTIGEWANLKGER
ncbi:MAG: CHAT domain-containing protein [Acidobacteriota bacterium]|nr:CHAT domain-containing protein [Acidobacteriota bacterium]